MPVFETLITGNMVAVFGAAVVANYGLGFLVRRVLARWQVVDRPNARSSHDIPTPRGGGMGIMIVVLAGGSWVGWQDGNRLIWPVLAGAGPGGRFLLG